MNFIPQIQPWIDSSELGEIKKVIESTYITENEATQKFEKMISDFTGAKYVIAYANGTLALAAALMAIGLKNGDEVLVPDLTFIATANAVILAGGKPVFCDIEELGWQISPESILKKISTKTKAIMPVHLYGIPANMPEIIRIAKENNLYVIEDAAESIGAKLNGIHVGRFGDIGMISFYANKIITTAEGGVLLTDNADLARELYKLKNHGRPVKGIFIHESIGFNFSFSDLHAAVGIAQMKKLDKILKKKEEIFNNYLMGLKDVKEVIIYEAPKNIAPAYWFTNIEVPDAETLETYLKVQGIGSRRFFYPLHRQPCYENKFGTDSDFPNSCKLFQTGLSLPSSYNLTKDEQDFVIQKIREYFKK